MNHLETNNILAAEQFGFRPSSSTELASFNFINNTLNQFQIQNNIAGIFLDLQKAFDYLYHYVLLNKFSFYGKTGGFLKLIRTYLQNRYKRFVLSNNYSISTSDWGEITHGVPQGSILGLLLFLLYIIDLPSLTNKNNKIVLFADDTSLFISNPDLINFRNNVNEILQHIKKMVQCQSNIFKLGKDSFYAFYNKK